MTFFFPSRSQNDCWGRHWISEESSRCDYFDGFLFVSFCPSWPTNLHGCFNSKVYSWVSRRKERTTVRTQRVRISFSQSLERLLPELEQLVLDGGQARPRPLRQLERGRHLPRKLHLPAGLRPQPQLRVHELRHLRVGFLVGLPAYDPGLLGGAVSGVNVILNFLAYFTVQQNTHYHWSIVIWNRWFVTCRF